MQYQQNRQGRGLAQAEEDKKDHLAATCLGGSQLPREPSTSLAPPPIVLGGRLQRNRTEASLPGCQPPPIYSFVTSIKSWAEELTFNTDSVKIPASRVTARRSPSGSLPKTLTAWGCALLCLPPQDGGEMPIFSGLYLHGRGPHSQLLRTECLALHGSPLPLAPPGHISSPFHVSGKRPSLQSLSMHTGLPQHSLLACITLHNNLIHQSRGGPPLCL